MAQMPIEVVNVGDVSHELVEQAMKIANSIQSEFLYLSLPETEANHLKLHAYKQVYAPDFLDAMEHSRTNSRGFHPYLIAFIDGELEGEKLGNLFSSCREEKGLAVTTIFNVPDLIIPSDKLSAYFLYYLAKNTIKFIVTEPMNHDDTRNCVYDQKIDKRDLLKSMKARSLCDDCRRKLLSVQSFLSALQLRALESIFTECGEVIDDKQAKLLRAKSRPRVFIGSSTEGINTAEIIQLGLERVAECTIWSQGVFGLSLGTLENLVNGVSKFDYGVLVLTPDDLTTKRNATTNTPRDNVLFELGLFMGALGREHTFIVYGRDDNLDLPTDLAGVAAATFARRADNNLEAALGPVCTRLKREMKLL